MLLLLVDDVLLRIFSILEPLDVLALRHVCRRLYNLADERSFWINATKDPELFAPPLDIESLPVSKIRDVVIKSTRVNENWRSGAPKPVLSRLQLPSRPCHLKLLGKHLFVCSARRLDLYDLERRESVCGLELGSSQSEQRGQHRTGRPGFDSKDGSIYHLVRHTSSTLHYDIFKVSPAEQTIIHVGLLTIPGDSSPCTHILDITGEFLVHYTDSNRKGFVLVHLPTQRIYRLLPTPRIDTSQPRLPQQPECVQVAVHTILDRVQVFLTREHICCVWNTLPWPVALCISVAPLPDLTSDYQLELEVEPTHIDSFAEPIELSECTLIPLYSEIGQKGFAFLSFVAPYDFGIGLPMTAASLKVNNIFLKPDGSLRLISASLPCNDLVLPLVTSAPPNSARILHVERNRDLKLYEVFNYHDEHAMKVRVQRLSGFEDIGHGLARTWDFDGLQGRICMPPRIDTKSPDYRPEDWQFVHIVDFSQPRRRQDQGGRVKASISSLAATFRDIALKSLQIFRVHTGLVAS